MNIPETITSRVSFNKFGEMTVSFKVKKEDVTPEMRDYFMRMWEEGISLALVTQEFQSERNAEQPEEKPLEEKKKTVYERLRWEVVKNVEESFKDKAWMNYKIETAIKNNQVVNREKATGEKRIISSSEIWTPAEAEAEILKFQGFQ